MIDYEDYDGLDAFYVSDRGSLQVQRDDDQKCVKVSDLKVLYCDLVVHQ